MSGDTCTSRCRVVPSGASQLTFSLTTCRLSVSTRSISERRSSGLYEIWRSLSGCVTSAALRPNIARAAWLIAETRPSRSTTIWASLACSNAVSRRRMSESKTRLGPGLHDARHPRLHVRAVVLHEHAALDVDRLEEARAAVQRLRLAEHEVAAWPQGEEEVAEDPLLRLLAEVHQRVARDEEVDARDGRILKQVVAAEDDGAAEAVAESVAGRRASRSSARAASSGTSSTSFSVNTAWRA